MKSPVTKCGVVILAAGNSSRLGRPKQLIKFRDKSLLQITTDAAVQTAGKQVVVVTGAYAAMLNSELAHMPVHVVHNEYWQEGMASSIYCGLTGLLKIFPYINNVIFCVSDQPYVSDKLLKELIKKQTQSGKGIVAAFYNNTAGVPVLFNCKYFGELLALQGQEGAKILLKKYSGDVATVDFPEGNIDIDSEADHVQLQFRA